MEIKSACHTVGSELIKTTLSAKTHMYSTESTETAHYPFSHSHSNFCCSSLKYCCQQFAACISKRRIKQNAGGVTQYFLFQTVIQNQNRKIITGTKL